MHSYAQTNLQLYNQMIDAKYSEADLACTFKGYELAMKLFSGRYRANGKPFLAHLIGTASILVTQNSPVNIVVAGLLHAAYMQGDFGYQEYGITNTKQKYLAQVVGDEIEALVTRYTSFPWDDQAISTTRNRINKLSELEQQVVLIRLANELEDELDLGMLYCKKAGYSPTEVDNPIVEIAFELGYSTLAEQLVKTLRRAAMANVPSILKREEESSFSVSPVFSQPLILRLLKSIRHRLTNKIAAKLRRFRSILQV